MRLFSWFILRRLWHEPLRSSTTALGIALGVAVIVAVQLTNASSLAGFRTALDTMSGRATLEIVGTSLGIDERHLTDLGWIRELGPVAPVVEGEVVLRQPDRPTERLRVLGIDILRDRPFRDYRLLEWSGRSDEPTTQEFLELLLDPGAAILTARFAGPRGLAVGSTIAVNVGDREVALTVRGLLRDEGPARVLNGGLVLMDIAAAQQLLDRFGRLDRIEVQVPEDRLVGAESAIGRRLPPGLAVQRPSRRGQQAEQMLAAFHLNLTALSYVALLVGLFLVYNTVAVAVLSRREEIGTLRAIGVSRQTVRALFLAEAATLGVTGAAIGLGIGRLLADGAVALTSTAVSALYIATAAAPPAIEMRHVVLAFGSAVPLALLAALIPSQEAARVAPIAALRGATRLEISQHAPRRRLWLPLGLLALAAITARMSPVDGRPLFAYLSALAIIFGAALLVPAVLTGLSRALVRFAKKRLAVPDWLGASNLAASIARVSISVAALGTSLSMMVALAIMIGSFRETVRYWVAQTLQADLFISPGAQQRPSATGALSAELIRLVAQHEDVLAVDRFRMVEVAYGPAGIRVGGSDFAVILAHGSLLYKSPADAKARMRDAIGQDVVVVSEAFALKHGHRPDDVITLPTSRGHASMRIAAVYYDYSSDRGVVMMDRSTFERHYDDREASGITVYLKDGIDADAARARLLTAIGDAHHVFINTNRALRTEVLRIFDSTFTITYALEVIAIAVAMLGVAATLLTLTLERAQDFTILRLIGTGRSQIRRMVVGEALIIGAISQAIGLVVGFLLSLVLIYVVNVQSFGWTIQFHLPVTWLAQSSALMVLATAVAGLYPARRAVRLTLAPQE